MKKLILSAITIATMTVSCKKENIKHIAPDSSTPTETNSTASAARVVPQGNMEDYIVDAKDPQNERVNKALYNYMVGMRKVFATDPTFLQQALDLAKTTPLKTVDLHEFICRSNACKLLFNGELCAKYPEKGTQYDYCVKLLEEMDYKYLNYEKDYYEPGMYIVNADNANLNQGYYLALAEEVYNADENHDYIPAWHVLKNGNVRLELLNEQQANQSKEPVVIFNPVGRYYGTGPYSPPVYFPPVLERDPYIPPPPPTGNNFVPGQIYHDYIQISEHFENVGKSEYRISYCISDANGDVVDAVDEKSLVDVPRNYVDCHCVYGLASQPFFNAASYNTVMTFITYEYDWYTTAKYITPGGSYQLKFKAKYDSERYQTYGNTPAGTRSYDNAGGSVFLGSDNYQVHAITKN